MFLTRQFHNGGINKVLLPALAAIFVFSVNLKAQEHPSEHPKEHPKEHPSSQKAGLTKESLAVAITIYLEKESALKGGYFLVFDTKANEPLALTLDKVHKDRLATIGDGVYFACADFKATNGKMYDLDIFMKEAGKDLSVSEISVHKKDGKERYTWYEKDGVWLKKSM